MRGNNVMFKTSKNNEAIRGENAYGSRIDLAAIEESQLD